MTLYGYARISNAEQTPTTRPTPSCAPGWTATTSTSTPGARESLTPEAGPDLGQLQAGDTLTITQLERLSRSVQHLINLGADLCTQSTGLHVIE